MLLRYEEWKMQRNSTPHIGHQMIYQPSTYMAVVGWYSRVRCATPTVGPLCPAPLFGLRLSEWGRKFGDTVGFFRAAALSVLGS